MRKILTFTLIVLIYSNIYADDKVRNETRVNKVWSDLNIKGNGVIVAILDRGIDYTHPDFTNDDGTTRILYIFDLTDNSGANNSNNPYNVGTIYDEAQINSALSSGTLLSTRDAVGHGTSTTGLAAGNGRASNGLYSGMAPNSKIIMVKTTTEGAPAHDGEPAEAPFYNPDLIETAINFVKAKAEEANLPVVMLANFGSVGGPMDGTSKLARMIDSEFGPEHPGQVFVSGSSDDGGLPNHAGGIITQSESIDIKIKNTTNQLRVDLWYDGSDKLDVEIITETKTYGPYISPSTNQVRDQQFVTEFNYYHNGSDVDFFVAENNKREIMFDCKVSGNYTLRLTGSQISNGSFHASLNPSRIFAGNENVFETFVVPGYTVWDLATAYNNIVPNSYVIRQNWLDIDGISRTDLGNEVGEGNLWVGSGVGPTYDERLGMTVSVPGNSNIAPYAERSYFATFNHVLVNDGNGKYGIQSAVSGAAPVLTGIIALMLEANPLLNSVQVKEILQNTARSDNFTGTTPNTKWGYGKVDAFAAVSEVLNATSVQEVKNELPNEFVLNQNYPNPFNPTTSIKFNLPTESKVRLNVFNVLGEEVAELVNNNLQAGFHSVQFDARSLNSGIYFYKIEAGDPSAGSGHGFVQIRKMMLLK
ncbi:MAG: S8 family peptidase [Ignavibacteriales bacterium]|nr:S8 family peptidase [Ignavibacteriales bacterium]